MEGLAACPALHLPQCLQSFTLMKVCFLPPLAKESCILVQPEQGEGGKGAPALAARVEIPAEVLHKLSWSWGAGSKGTT